MSFDKGQCDLETYSIALYLLIRANHCLTVALDEFSCQIASLHTGLGTLCPVPVVSVTLCLRTICGTPNLDRCSLDSLFKAVQQMEEIHKTVFQMRFQILVLHFKICHLRIPHLHTHNVVSHPSCLLVDIRIVLSIF